MGKIGRGRKRVKTKQGSHRLRRVSSSSGSSPLQAQGLAFHTSTKSGIAGVCRWAGSRKQKRPALTAVLVRRAMPVTWRREEGGSRAAESRSPGWVKGCWASASPALLSTGIHQHSLQPCSKEEVSIVSEDKGAGLLTIAAPKSLVSWRLIEKKAAPQSQAQPQSPQPGNPRRERLLS